MAKSSKKTKSASNPPAKAFSKALATMDANDKLVGMFSLNLPGVGQYRLEDFASYLKAGSKYVWAAYRACRMVSDVISTTEFSFQAEGSNDPVDDEQLMAFVEKPNDFDSWTTFLGRWTFHMKCTGNAFGLKDGVNALGEPSKVWLLNPKLITIYVNKDRGVTGYGYALNGKMIPYDLDEIIHWRLPSPDNEFWGVGEIESAETLFNRTIAQDKFSEQFYASGGAPSSIIAREEEMDEREFRRLKSKWNDEYHGSKNAGKTAWLTGKWKYMRLGLSMSDMEAAASRKANVAEIFSQMGIPPSMTGMEQGGNRQSSQEDDKKFRRYTILPLLKIFAEKFNTEFVREVNPSLALVFKLGGLAYISDLVADYEPLMAVGGITPNDLRVICGLERGDDPLLDRYYIGTHLVPIDMVGQVQTPTNAQQDNRTQTVDDSGKSIAMDQARMTSRDLVMRRHENLKKKPASPGLIKSAAVELVGRPRFWTKAHSSKAIQTVKSLPAPTSASEPKS